MRSAQLRLSALAATFLSLWACRSAELPPLPSRAPGSLRVTVLTARPGRSELVPAKGATATLLGTTLTASADDDGNLALTDLRATTGQVLFSLDLDADGNADRTRTIALEAVNAGFGKDVNLGQLVLGRNATVVGKVLRADRRTLTAGHGGISVFLPQLPQLTLSGDDGSFVLSGVPEGTITISYFTPGYQPDTSALTVEAGEEKRAGVVELTAAPGLPAIGALTGKVEGVDGTPIAAVTVRATDGTTETSRQTNAEGVFNFEQLATGVYIVGFEKTGLRPLRLDGVLVQSGANAMPAIVMTSGTGMLGSLDSGIQQPADAGDDDGGMRADSGMPIDSGTPGPVAVVGPAQVVLAGAQVTLDGMASTGDQPLTYTWSLLGGDAGVVLSANESVTAHSPRFTAPMLGTVLEFSLMVKDRFNRVSTNTAVARVAVGSVPVARFGPDGGSFRAGDVVQLTSSSFDDGGLALIGHAWSLTTPSSGAAVVGDGGTAYLQLPSLMATDSPVIVGVELVVTNSIGATSAPARQSYVAVPGIAGGWTLSAELVGTSPVVYDGANTPVRLIARANTSVPSPNIAYSWSCIDVPGPYNQLDGGVFEFLPPVVQGAQLNASCTVTGTASAPLTPATQTATVGFAVRDAFPPSLTLARPGSSSSRISPFGIYVVTSEPVPTISVNGGCFPVVVERVGPAMIFHVQQYSQIGTTCPALSANIYDGASPPNLATVTFAPASNVTPLWQGPLVSTADYEAPWPAVVTAGVLPRDLQALAPPSPAPLPWELVAREGGSLVTFSPNFLALPTTCSPDCPLTGTQRPLSGLDPALEPPPGIRVANAGQELLVAMQRPSDGGLDTLYARRSPTGTWSALQTNGELHSAGTDVRRARILGSSVVSDVFDPTTSSFVFPEVVTPDAGTGFTITTGQSKYFAGSGILNVFRGNTVEAFTRVSATSSWTKTVHAQLTGYLHGRAIEETCCSLVSSTVLSRSIAPHMVHLDSNGQTRAINTLGPATGGFDLLNRGSVAVLAIAQGGDLRLYYGSIYSPTEVAGPPRSVPLAPGDNRLDLDPSCEAAAPRLAFIEDALVIAWQERCAPSTRWKVAVRVMR